MEAVHDPDGRPWISKRVKPGSILDEFSEEMRREKPIINMFETRPKKMMEMIGVESEDLFKELESVMNIDNLHTKGEMEPVQCAGMSAGKFGVGVPRHYNRGIPQGGVAALKTLEMQQEYLTASTDKKMKNRRTKKLREDNDNWYLTYPKPSKSGVNRDMTDVRQLYCVRVYRPFKQLYTEIMPKRGAYTQEIWLLGEHKLVDLKERIRCPADLHVVGKQQVDTLKSKAPRAVDVYPSSFIWIEGCFYNDTRHPNHVDLSQPIIAWANNNNRGIGSFSTASMEDTRLNQLELRLGYPYVYVHQGNHEHLVVFYDIRLLGPEDPQTPSSYPYLRSIGTHLSKYCYACQAQIATWVTSDNERVPENPFFFCDFCYKHFNFVNGKRVGSFKELRYFDINSI